MNENNAKRIDSLSVSDLEASSVWRYSARAGSDETYVVPVRRIPVESLSGKVVGTQVRLANGALQWALLGNVDARNVRLTEHFLTLSLLSRATWFTLSRYHDFDYPQRGPAGLAEFLGLPIDEIFPISYDIRAFANGEAAALMGRIEAVPRERLSRAEIIALAVL